MKNSAAIHNDRNQHCRPTMKSDHPLLDEDYHHMAWSISDISAPYKSDSSILLLPLPMHSINTMFSLSDICHLSKAGAMETRETGKRSSPQAPDDPPGRRPSKDLKRAVKIARAFKQGLPPHVQQEVQGMENWFWQNVEEAKFDGELDEYKQWVKDPSYTTGHLALYDRALAYYWATKQLCGLLMNKKSAKEEAENEPTKMWKPHYRETHMIHIKLDAIANKLGMPFLPKDTTANFM